MRTNDRFGFARAECTPGKIRISITISGSIFHGTGLTPITETNANHSVSFSADLKHFVDVLEQDANDARYT